MKTTLAALLLCAPVLVLAAADTVDTVLLFTSFRDNGQDGLHFLWSEDGYAWHAVGDDRSYLRPEIGGRLMRDPQITAGPDGIFHLVWTTAWEKQGVGYASSRDLIHWSEQRLIDVMKSHPDARNVWAPELFYDREQNRYLLFWSSTIPGKFPETGKSGDRGYNHRIYVTSTPDFSNFEPTRLFLDPGFSCIDATIVANRDRFLMFFKNETRYPPAKNLRMAEGPAPAGPFTPTASPITGDFWAEGPSAIKLGDTWFVYFDRYVERRYGLVTSRDLVTWRDDTARVSFPPGHRHGSVLRVGRSLLSGLQAH